MTIRMVTLSHCPGDSCQEHDFQMVTVDTSYMEISFCNTCRAFNYQFWLVVLVFFGPNHVLALENSNMLGQSPPEFLVDSPNFQPGQLFWLLLFLVVLVSPWDEEQMPVSMSLLTKWTYQSS